MRMMGFVTDARGAAVVDDGRGTRITRSLGGSERNPAAA